MTLTSQTQLDQEGFRLVESPHFLYAYHPELSEYLRFHDAIDRFIWLFRLRYAPRETLRDKKYRLDVLFQLFIKENAINLEKIARKLVGKEHSKHRFLYFLIQGWYNELATAYPFVEDPMNLSTHLSHCDAQSKVDLFPSWQIIKSYYSVYAFYNAFVFTNNKNLSTYQHRKSTNHFNVSLLKKFSQNILFYPFNLSYPLTGSPKSLRRGERPEWNFKYAHFPRHPDKDIYDIEMEFIRDLRRVRKELKQQAPVSIIDLLYSFRVWSNYVGHKTIVKLRSGGLLLFLERNLFSTVFLSAGLCELVALGFLGEKLYLQSFRRFHNDFIVDRDELYMNWSFIPQVVRLNIYKHLGLITKLPKDVKPPNLSGVTLI
jgi:hypothetical protein